MDVHIFPLRTHLRNWRKGKKSISRENIIAPREIALCWMSIRLHPTP
jgi:hypothetical protein